MAQKNDIEASKKEKDSIIYGEQVNDYIYIYKNRVTAMVYYINTSNSLTLIDRDNSNLEFALYPNKQDKIGASLAFRSVSGSFSFSPNSMAETKDLDSELFNLNFRVYLGTHWMQTIDVYYQKGFHLDDGNLNVYLPKTKSFKIGGSTSYIFNENFSFRARDIQNEKQLKSTGSFIPGVVYYYTKHSLRAEDIDSGQNVDSDFSSINFALAPSYLYNFVPTENLLISAGISAGLGVNFSKTQEESLTSLLTELDFSGTITYEVDDLYFGAKYNYLILNYNSDRSAYVKDNIPYLQVFIGYRFKASRKWVNKADTFNKKIDDLSNKN